MDGARLCNAAVKSGHQGQRLRGLRGFALARLQPKAWARRSALARRFEGLHQGSLAAEANMLGGSMRQSGVIARAALYALEHNWDRLAEDPRQRAPLSPPHRNIKGLACEVAKRCRPTSSS